MKTERTKGEWIVTESLNGDIYIGSENISIAKIWSPTAKADAEYICKAVNNHDRLVEALRAFVEAYEKSLQLEKTDQALKLAREAFAELEGEK